MTWIFFDKKKIQYIILYYEINILKLTMTTAKL